MREPKQAAAIRYAMERAGKGVCLSCGEPVESHAVHPRCTECERLLRNAKGKNGWFQRKSARLRLRRIAAGMCPGCGRNAPASGRRKCITCLEKNAAAQMRRKELRHG